MPRMLRRAAVLGATAHVAHKHGEAEAEQQMAAEQQAAPPEVQPAPVQAAPPAPSAASDESYDELMKLKQLLDAGVLTQTEFDDQKQKVLSV